MKNKCLEKSAFFFSIILETYRDEGTLIDINDKYSRLKKLPKTSRLGDKANIL